MRRSSSGLLLLLQLAIVSGGVTSCSEGFAVDIKSVPPPPLEADGLPSEEDGFEFRMTADVRPGWHSLRQPGLYQREHGGNFTGSLRIDDGRFRMWGIACTFDGSSPSFDHKGVVVEDDQLYFVDDDPDVDERSFWPIVWDDAELLVEDDAMLRFCNSVNDGSLDLDNSYDYFGYWIRFRPRASAPPTPAPGPLVPERWAPYVLECPVTGEFLGATARGFLVSVEPPGKLLVGHEIIARIDRTEDCPYPSAEDEVPDVERMTVISAGPTVAEVELPEWRWRQTRYTCADLERATYSTVRPW